MWEKMQRRREVRENSSMAPGSAFHSFKGFDSQGSMFPSIFGGRDPFDDPFFSRPFDSMFGSSIFGSNSTHGESQQVSANRSKGPVIEELDSDDETPLEDNEEGRYKENTWSNKNPLIEHPEDQTSEHGKSTGGSKEASFKTNHSKVEGSQPQSRSVSFQRVTYGGINGPYHSATTTRRTGSDGVTLEESKRADTTTGKATHRISRGIHDKGHSLTRNLDSDGKVDTMQTLHNLAEDDLANFEEAWKGNADGHLFAGSTGSGRTDLATWGDFAPLTGRLRRGGIFVPGQSSQAQSSGGRPRKVRTINIE